LRICRYMKQLITGLILIWSSPKWSQKVCGAT
jgi:hypothetical protein